MGVLKTSMGVLKTSMGVLKTTNRYAEQGLSNLQ